MSRQRLATLIATLVFTSTALMGCTASNAATQASNAATAEAAKAKETPAQEGIYNYIEYSDRFASSGQPTAEQLKAQKAAGV